MPDPSPIQPERLGTFTVSSLKMDSDRLGRIGIEVAVSDLAEGLRDSSAKQVGFQVLSELVLASPGGCQIDCQWNVVEQLALLSPTGDPRLDWLSAYAEEVELIRANAQHPTPKLAGELGLSLKHLAFHEALAQINGAGYTVALILRDMDQTRWLPLLTPTDLSVLRAGKDKVKVVDNMLLAVGGDKGNVLIYVKGHNRPIFLEGGDEDALHELRKKGVRVRGTLEERDGKEFLINATFTLLEEQPSLL